MDKYHHFLLKNGHSKLLSQFRRQVATTAKKIFAKANTTHPAPPESSTGLLFYDSEGGKHTSLQSNVLFFAGSGVDRERNTKTGIRDLKYINNAFGIKAHLYVQPTHTTSSNSEAWMARLEDASEINYSPHYYSPEAADFVNQAFMPKIDACEKDNIEKIAESMRFTLIGQSYGPTSIQMSISCLDKKMQARGYTDAQIQQVFDNILVVSLSGAIPILGRDRPSPKIIGMEHVLDYVGWLSNRHGIHPDLNQDESLREDPDNPLILNVSDHLKFFWTDFHWKDEKHPEGIDFPTPDHIGYDYGYHDIHSMTDAIKQGVFPEEILTAVHRSVNENGNLPSLTDLLKAPPQKQSHPAPKA